MAVIVPPALRLQPIGVGQKPASIHGTGMRASAGEFQLDNLQTAEFCSGELLLAACASQRVTAQSP